MKSKKRFIAGAKCPNCSALDSLIIYCENEVEILECVECQYQKNQTETKPLNEEKNQAIIGIFKQ